MPKVKELLYEAPEGYDYYYEFERITDPDLGGELFYVTNLAECPEDAIIGRDLFSSRDWLSAVRYGIALAGQGYTDVELKEVKDEA